jgi:hypothetical protein
MWRPDPGEILELVNLPERISAAGDVPWHEVMSVPRADVLRVTVACKNCAKRRVVSFIELERFIVGQLVGNTPCAVMLYWGQCHQCRHVHYGHGMGMEVCDD